MMYLRLQKTTLDGNSRLRRPSPQATTHPLQANTHRLRPNLLYPLPMLYLFPATLFSPNPSASAFLHLALVFQPASSLVYPFHPLCYFLTVLLPLYAAPSLSLLLPSLSLLLHHRGAHVYLPSPKLPFIGSCMRLCAGSTRTSRCGPLPTRGGRSAAPTTAPSTARPARTAQHPSHPAQGPGHRRLVAGPVGRTGRSDRR